MDVDVVPNVSPVHISAVESRKYMQLDMITFNYIWTCTEIRTLIEGDDYDSISPLFSYGTNDEPKFELQLKSLHEDVDGTYYYSVYLQLASSYKKEVEAKFKFAIIKANGEKVNEMDTKGSRILRPGELQGRTKFIECDRIETESNELLIDGDKLRIFCEVTIYRESDLFKTSNSILADDLSQLLNYDEYSDVTLSVNCGYEYKVHKNILAARSPVFAAMFKNDMEERNSGQVIITDVDNDVLKEMIRFIYTGRTLSLDKMAEELLVAADKYQLENLKGMCQEALANNLSIDNAPKMLSLADFLHADQLKVKTIDFITTHASDIVESAAFQAMFNSHPQLIEEAFRALATKSIPKTSSSIAL